ncbi:MAG: LVIVD repeat-containing protein [Candidatus Odinarchaeota archaeon]
MGKDGQLIAASILLAFFITTCLAGSAIPQGNSQEITLQEMGQIDTPGFARDVVIREVGSTILAYVADMGTAFGSTYGGLLIYNVSNPQHPKAMGSFYDGGRSHHIFFIEDDVALVTDNTGGLEIFNVSDPWNPDKISQFNANYINDLAVQGTIVFVTDFLDGVIALDVSNLTNPVEIGLFSIEHVQPIKIIGNLAYVSGSNNLILLNIMDPTNITEVARYDLQVSRIQTTGNTAYMACSGSWLEPADGFKIMNITDPLNLEEIGSYHDGGHPIDLQVSGNTAFVSDGDEGIEVLDISNPSSIKEIAGYYDGGNATGIQVVGDLIFVADGPDGLEILRIIVNEGTTSPTAPGFGLFFATTALALVTIKWKTRGKRLENH